MHAGDRKGALMQLSSSGALLFAVLAPATAGLVIIAPKLVNLAIAESFRPITLAVLPISAIAGGVRNMRVHFADQSTLLFERTDLTIFVNALEAVMVIVGCFVGLRLQGLVGAAEGACVGLTIGVIFSFGMARKKFGLIVPFARMARICLATAAMVAVLLWSPWEAALAGHRVIGLLVQIAVGAIVYLAAMAALHPAQLHALAKPGLLWSGRKSRDAISRVETR
jgi:O-antigen/teichoic acid export membrane protein